jgi:hypothetical protein
LAPAGGMNAKAYDVNGIDTRIRSLAATLAGG